MSSALTFAAREQEVLIRELVAFNQRIHNSMENLHQRLSAIEAARAFSHTYPPPALAPAVQLTSGYRGVADGRSRSPSPDGRGYRHREAPLNSRKVRGRKQLQIQVPGKMYKPPGTGLATPNTSFTV